MRRRVLGFALAVCQVVLPAAVAAQQRDTAPPVRPLVVAITDSPPFAIKEPDGTWTGLSVALWSEIATQLGWRWELRETALERIDQELHDRTVDAALGAVAVTAAGAALHDYSASYHTTGIGFAEHADPMPSWRRALTAMLDSQVLRVIAGIAIAVLFVGLLIALIERRSNPDQFGGPLPRSVATGVWWAAVTMTTVGYGDTTPKSTPGRTLALLWMFIGVVVVAVFTATVTSILTVGSLRTAVQHPTDLLALRLGAVLDSAGAQYLADRHVGYRGYERYEDALQALADHQVDAVVGNTAVLRYLVKNDWHGVVRVSALILEPMSYAIGLPSGSPLRDAVNRELLHVIEQDQWHEVEHRYLGHQ
jgi:polar amino acid transport system substrate-binding protein